jgi:hypothetical protein
MTFPLIFDQNRFSVVWPTVRAHPGDIVLATIVGPDVRDGCMIGSGVTSASNQSLGVVAETPSRGNCPLASFLFRSAGSRNGDLA